MGFIDTTKLVDVELDKESPGEWYVKSAYSEELGRQLTEEELESIDTDTAHEMAMEKLI